MRKFVTYAAFAALLALPAMASAQAGGVCLFSGSAALNPPLGTVPTPCTSLSGCPGYTFSGTTSGPTCLGLAGSVVSNDGKWYGSSACAGNVHGGTASTKVGPITYYGVCAGPDCSGAGYNAAGRAFQYNLVFNVDTLTRATVGGECAGNKFKSAVFDGSAEGGSL